MIERHRFASIESCSPIARLVELATRIDQLEGHFVVRFIASDRFLDPFREIARVMQFVAHIFNAQQIGPIIVPMAIVAFRMQQLFDQAGSLVWLIVFNETIELAESRNTPNSIQVDAATEGVVVDLRPRQLIQSFQLLGDNPIDLTRVGLRIRKRRRCPADKQE